MPVWTSMLTCMAVFMDSTEAYTCHIGAITVYNGIEGMALQIFHPCHTRGIYSCLGGPVSLQYCRGDSSGGTGRLEEIQVLKDTNSRVRCRENRDRPPARRAAAIVLSVQVSWGCCR